MKSFLEESLLDPITLTVFDDNNYPLILPCGQTYGSQSLQQLTRNICPECRKPFDLNTVNKNYKLIEVIDSLRNHRPSESIALIDIKDDIRQIIYLRKQILYHLDQILMTKRYAKVVDTGSTLMRIFGTFLSLFASKQKVGLLLNASGIVLGTMCGLTGLTNNHLNKKSVDNLIKRHARFTEILYIEDFLVKKLIKVSVNYKHDDDQLIQRSLECLAINWAIGIRSFQEVYNVCVQNAKLESIKREYEWVKGFRYCSQRGISALDKTFLMTSLAIQVGNTAFRWMNYIKNKEMFETELKTLQTSIVRLEYLLELPEVA